MLLRVTELCRYNDEEKEQIFEDGLRVMHYKTDANNFEESIKELIEFDFKKMLTTEDYFPGECLESKIIGVQVIG